MVLVNSNPAHLLGAGCRPACHRTRSQLHPVQATIMTDPGTADRTYIGPMTPELVEEIIAKACPQTSWACNQRAGHARDWLKTQLPAPATEAERLSAGCDCHIPCEEIRLRTPAALPSRSVRMRCCRRWGARPG